jgi:Cysteine synthase
MVIKAKELADKHGYFWPNQFENEANAWIHEKTTGPEILEAFQEASIPMDHFVCSYGTGGTLLGVGRYLRKHSPKTQIHICEPSNAPMLYSDIPTRYPPENSSSSSSSNSSSTSDENGTKQHQYPSTSFESPHPVWRPHLLQGWATDFIPRLVSSATNEKLYDSILHVGGHDAIETAKKLARTEGIFSGTSGGGTLSAALKLAQGLSERSGGKNIVVMIPDTGERYLSTPLFEDIPADMTPEELELAQSTPSTPPPPPALPHVTKQATEWVKKQAESSKVVIFSLEYCEFCWTLTSFLDALGVSYHKIDIDSFIYAKDNIGNYYRAALCEWTSCATFPQFFVAGKFVGGAVDACMMWKKGKLQKMFKKANVKSADGNFNNYSGDPFEFLPKWMTQNPLRSK